MTITIYEQLEQGTPEWLQARCGLITASEVKLLLTPTLKSANNDKSRSHVYELLAQRLTQYVEPSYISDDMLRGRVDEIDARNLYSEKINPVREVGFITNDKWGFTLGYSPDGLVGDVGAIECKSRRQKYQVQTIVNYETPEEYVLQLQTGMLVAELEWIDFISYCGGLPMFVKRVHPDAAIQEAILRAAADTEQKIAELERFYHLECASRHSIQTTRRTIEEEIIL